MSKHILIVDDEPLLRLSIKKLLEGENYKITTTAGLQETHKLTSTVDFDLAIVDLHLKDGTGTSLISSLRKKYIKLPAILITGEDSVSVTIVEAIKQEIFYFIPKPFEPLVLLNLVKKVLTQQDLAEQNKNLKNNLKKQFHFNQIIGQSHAIYRLTEWMHKVAKSSSNVLITGESGTGKELVARSIHCNQNSIKPFISVNCGAIPKDLLESEFFGHKKGSFTGALSNHKGYFEAAGSGTLFLDEIGTMDLNLQVKLLRVLQEKAFKPVGSTETIKTEARIIAATNIDLEKAVEEGRFRKDLYYRLNIIPLFIPPLRERKQDIPLLIQHFLKNFTKKKSHTISKEAMDLLCHYRWPGNIRELENLIERLCVFKEEGEFDVDDLPSKYQNFNTTKKHQGISFIDIPNEGIDFNKIVDQYESSLLVKALQKTKGNKKQAALLLNLNRTTLMEKIRKKGLITPDKKEFVC